MTGFFETITRRKERGPMLAAWIIEGKTAGAKALFEREGCLFRDDGFPEELTAAICAAGMRQEGILEKAGCRIFLEHVSGRRKLVICGAGHVSLSVIRCSRPVREPVRRIAVCGGAGADLIGEARRAGAQLYVTGDLSYHRFAVPEGFMVADIGHFEGEVEIVTILLNVLRKNFPNFAIRVSGRLGESNPVRYC